ncbi:C40 family peptidase [Kitasatospora purpeofusca]|uniref:C40 family peptidase n=1 Tax=Kitasatospora purpeofusca TaxID=67352 RepID=UPI0036D43338
MARRLLPTLLLSLTALLGLLPAAAAAPAEPGPSAPAEPPGPPPAPDPSGAAAAGEQAYPSAGEIDRARTEADRRAGTVTAIEAGLTAAKAETDRAARTAEEAVEAYNGAQLSLTRARAEESAAAARAAAAEAERAAAAEEAAALAAETYRQGAGAELSAINALLGAHGPREAGDRAAVIGVASDRTRQILDAAVSTAAGASRASAAAHAATGAAERAAAEVGAARARAEARLTDQQNQVTATGLRREQLLAELAAARSTTVELERQRREALEAIAAREAEARAASERAAAEAAGKAAADAARTLPPAGSAAAPPPPRSWSAEGAAAAIAFARARIGLPYVWGGEGPGGYDCSGLTMMAWREGGKRLNHFAADQYAQSTPVTYRQLRPGDLVFWSTTGRAADIHHVGLYIGDDQMIEAPRAGVPIKQASLWIMGTPDFYARP